jgi:hypothetical protein
LVQPVALGFQDIEGESGKVGQFRSDVPGFTKLSARVPEERTVAEHGCRDVTGLETAEKCEEIRKRRLGEVLEEFADGWRECRPEFAQALELLRARRGGHRAASGGHRYPSMRM